MYQTIIVILSGLTFLITEGFCAFQPDKSVQLENDTLLVSVNHASGCFTVKEKVSGKEWLPDPWENAAGLLEISKNGKKYSDINLSASKSVEVRKVSAHQITIRFISPSLSDNEQLNNVAVYTSIRLDPKKAKLICKVEKVESPDNIKLEKLIYPARPFSLETDADKGAGVIPHWQGLICPSYIFPMNGGKFCQWDDAQWGGGTSGRLPYYGWMSLTMPWFGTYDAKSAVMGVLPKSPNGEMAYIINNNAQARFDTKNKISPYKRILSLMPVWNLQDQSAEIEIAYYFIPRGNYTHMAKIYRSISQERGYFKSLQQKAVENPEVKKLAGAMYIGIYGGYPHYINLPGVAFTFDQLKGIIQSIHDSLNVFKAFIHAWGTYSNYPPYNWPVSEALGGPEKLKQAVDLAKSYGYLYASYHSYIPALEHDPDFTADYLPRDNQGNILLRNRWLRNDSKYYKGLAEKTLEKELAAIGQNADVTDISFVHIPGNPVKGSVELARYIRQHKLVMGCERGEEYFIPYMELFEGMDAYNQKLANYSHPAPLFNLVYHDAVATYGKIQDNDLIASEYGDFPVKTLRKMVYGSGSTLFFTPYEYEGIKPMIKMAYNALSKLHENVFYAELINHEFLSPDFLLQKSEFSNGTKVIVNMAHAAHRTPEGEKIPGYGYSILYGDGTVAKGEFSMNLKINE